MDPSLVETEGPIGCTSTTHGRLAFDKSVKRLQPITTHQVSSHSVNESIPVLSSSMSPYLPPQWLAYTHPEGQVYFYHASELRVVTEANIYCPDVMDQVVYWAQWLKDRCCSEGISLSNDVELFIQLNKSEPDHCAYYFIEHGTRTQFWIDNTDTEALGLPHTVSTACIEELYWKHVERFPMHLTNLTPNPVNSLICLLSHTRDTLDDRLPFPADECAKILEVLNILQDNISDANAMRLVARLWGVMGIYI
ncbi:hypothetical protein PILCRDRAFT_640817 [Piloderma croceum F 1598]|uniref:WW domain-containing protein n=1 Tax=Piloderma croceum (strain F 1598) TaxID=765440 RepID=A0A0C3AS33_PILCF|nr:hypothetical protein PILCRDRAFT_640817 [Piloderma croceum F 1598]